MKSENKNIIMYVSEPWRGSMIDRPIYYKEARALVIVVSKCRPIIECSPHTVTVRTDHAPLRWIQHARRGPLAAWRVEELSGIDYEVEYISGSKNCLADALSRFPVVAHQAPTLEGLDAMLQSILSSIDAPWRLARTFWVWFDRDTTTLARQVQTWRGPTNPLVTTSPNARAFEADWNVALMAPAAEVAPVLCAQLFTVGKPFACLVPNELVTWIPVSVDPNGDQEVKNRLARSRKSLSWPLVLHG